MSNLDNLARPISNKHLSVATTEYHTQFPRRRMRLGTERRRRASADSTGNRLLPARASVIMCRIITTEAAFSHAGTHTTGVTVRQAKIHRAAIAGFE